MEFPAAYRKWHSCDPLELYSVPVSKFVPNVSPPGCSEGGARMEVVHEAIPCPEEDRCGNARWDPGWLVHSAGASCLLVTVCGKCCVQHRHVAVRVMEHHHCPWSVIALKTGQQRPS
eukprot:322859-Chlamydomonas_euryale.AAC.1